MNNNVLHIYTDEAGVNNRFRALCAISGEESNLNELKIKLEEIKKEFDVSELKFTDIRTHISKIKCAKAFIEKAIDFARENKIRIDILIWDINDTRHRIEGRDDKENLERMYYHLILHIIRIWRIYKIHFYPDEHSEFDYKKIKYYLELTKSVKKSVDKIPLLLKLFEEQAVDIKIIRLQSMNSTNCVLIQLADIFAGFGRFSREKKDNFSKYVSIQKNKFQLSLFESIQNNPTLSKADIVRLEITDFIANYCKEKQICISIETEGYLKSYSPELPINFWHYEPQGKYDKAPTKK